MNKIIITTSFCERNLVMSISTTKRKELAIDKQLRHFYSIENIFALNQICFDDKILSACLVIKIMFRELIKQILERNNLESEHVHILRSEHVHILRSWNVVAKVDDVLRKIAVINVLKSMIEHRCHHVNNDMWRNKFHSLFIDLNCNNITRAINVERHNHCCERWCQKIRNNMWNIDFDDHCKLVEVFFHKRLIFLWMSSIKDVHIVADWTYQNHLVRTRVARKNVIHQSNIWFT